MGAQQSAHMHSATSMQEIMCFSLYYRHITCVNHALITDYILDYWLAVMYLIIQTNHLLNNNIDNVSITLEWYFFV